MHTRGLHLHPKVRFLPRRLFITTIILITLASCTPVQVPGTTSPTAAPPAETATPTRNVEQPAPTTVELQVSKVWEAPYRTLILVHYMPWYQTPAGSGYWGWHWKMDHYDPKQVNEQGLPTIASHFHPLTGPYDSGDPDLLEYQVMLMKLSGIDGLIVDWYGFESFWDYGKINASTQKLFQQVQEAGLLFAVTYEDRTVQYMLENGHLAVADPQAHGQEVMAYLQENWFQEDAYLKVDGQPILFVFGNPPYFSSDADWEVIFSGIQVQPYLITQDGLLVSSAQSGFPWPPMGRSGGGELTRAALEDYLDSFYAAGAGWDYKVAGVFPGFYDIYEQAGVGSSYGFLDSQGGQTLAFTFRKALDYGPDLIQVVTWNDYGEGTNIEPTHEYGSQYLEMIQQIRREHIDPTFPFEPQDLSLPLQIFNLRKQYADDQQVNARLDEAVLAVLAGQLELADQILADY